MATGEASDPLASPFCFRGRCTAGAWTEPGADAEVGGKEAARSTANPTSRIEDDPSGKAETRPASADGAPPDFGRVCRDASRVAEIEDDSGGAGPSGSGLEGMGRESTAGLGPDRREPRPPQGPGRARLPPGRIPQAPFVALQSSVPSRSQSAPQPVHQPCLPDFTRRFDPGRMKNEKGTCYFVGCMANIIRIGTEKVACPLLPFFYLFFYLLPPRGEQSPRATRPFDSMNEHSRMEQQTMHR